MSEMRPLFLYLCLLALLANPGCRFTNSRACGKVSPVCCGIAESPSLNSPAETVGGSINNLTASTETPPSAVLPASAMESGAGTHDATLVYEAAVPVLADISQTIVENNSLLTLDEAITLALANNPTIPQARSLVRQQQGTTVQAGLYPNPQIGYLRSDPDKSDKSRSSGAFLSQEFVTAGKLKLAQLASQYDVTLRCWQVTAQEQRVVNDVRIRFWELATTQQALTIAEEAVTSAADGVRIARSMRDSMIGTKPDVLQAEMQESTARGLRYDAQLRIDAARQALNSVVGSSLPICTVSTDFEQPLPELDWETSLRRLLTESPLLKSQDAELQAARAEIQLSDAQAIPNINTQMVAQRDSFENYSSISTFVSIPVPAFNRNQGNRISARAFYAQQVRESERLKLALADQLSTTLRQYKSLQNEQKRLQSEILPRASENLELTTAAYKAGRLDFQRVVDARTLLYQSKLAAIEARAELQKVFIEIDGLQLTGALNPTEVGTALQSTATSTNGARSILSQQLQNASSTTNRNLPGAIQAGDF